MGVVFGPVESLGVSSYLFFFFFFGLMVWLYVGMEGVLLDIGCAPQAFTCASPFLIITTLRGQLHDIPILRHHCHDVTILRNDTTDNLDRHVWV